MKRNLWNSHLTNSTPSQHDEWYFLFSLGYLESFVNPPLLHGGFSDVTDRDQCGKYYSQVSQRQSTSQIAAQLQSSQGVRVPWCVL